jgi:hypothetical protein
MSASGSKKGNRKHVAVNYEEDDAGGELIIQLHIFKN